MLCNVQQVGLYLDEEDILTPTTIVYFDLFRQPLAHSTGNNSLLYLKFTIHRSLFYPHSDRLLGTDGKFYPS